MQLKNNQLLQYHKTKRLTYKSKLKKASNAGNTLAINGIIQSRKNGIQIARFGVCILTVTSIVNAAQNIVTIYPPTSIS